jgi:hypothetical protein
MSGENRSPGGGGRGRYIGWGKGSPAGMGKGERQQLQQGGAPAAGERGASAARKKGIAGGGNGTRPPAWELRWRPAREQGAAVGGGAGASASGNMEQLPAGAGVHREVGDDVLVGCFFCFLCSVYSQRVRPLYYGKMFRIIF